MSEPCPHELDPPTATARELAVARYLRTRASILDSGGEVAQLVARLDRLAARILTGDPAGVAP